jgi:rSAM/selenodomain-associated transferase 1
MAGSPTQPQASICNAGADVAILFAKTPLPGTVKTRLLTHLTPEQACRLHIAATLDTADLLDATVRGDGSTARWIFWSEGCPPDAPSLSLPASFRAAVQHGASLGERMADAFGRAFACGARRVIIMGSDSPHLPPGRIPQAFAALELADCVLGPAADGGYYLIGCRRFDSGLFRAVEWGGPEVLEQTRANASLIGYIVSLLEPYYDLDEWKDVEHLLAEARGGMNLPPRVRAFLQQLEKEGGRAPGSGAAPLG